MAAYWTIRHAIDMKVLGVGFGVDVFTIEPSAKTYRARQLDDAEVAEHIDFIKECEQALRGGQARHQLVALSPSSSGSSEVLPSGSSMNAIRSVIPE